MSNLPTTDPNLAEPGRLDPAARTDPSPAARRALAEAEARRADIDRKAAAAAPKPERNGRGGPEPVRYDDWEIAGRAIDF